MASLGLAIPVLPGRSERDRSELAACWRGARRAAYEDARRRAGITKETVWIQTSATGDVAVIYIEADDLDAAFAVIGGSTAPFDQWFRDHVQDVHGVSLADGVPVTELVLDYDSQA